MQRNPTWGHFTAPSMIIGGDVSHGPGMTDQPSMAALTMSLDRRWLLNLFAVGRWLTP